MHWNGVGGGRRDARAGVGYARLLKQMRNERERHWARIKVAAETEKWSAEMQNAVCLRERERERERDRRPNRVCHKHTHTQTHTHRPRTAT